MRSIITACLLFMLSVGSAAAFSFSQEADRSDVITAMRELAEEASLPPKEMAKVQIDLEVAELNMRKVGNTQSTLSLLARARYELLAAVLRCWQDKYRTHPVLTAALRAIPAEAQMAQKQACFTGGIKDKA